MVSRDVIVWAGAVIVCAGAVMVIPTVTVVTGGMMTVDSKRVVTLVATVVSSNASEPSRAVRWKYRMVMGMARVL